MRIGVVDCGSFSGAPFFSIIPLISLLVAAPTPSLTPHLRAREDPDTVFCGDGD